MTSLAHLILLHADRPPELVVVPPHAAKELAALVSLAGRGRTGTPGKATGFKPVASTASATARQQPLSVAQQSGALLTVRTVAAVTGLSTTTVYRKVAAGEFPEPVKLGTRCTRWKSDAVAAWMALK